MKINKKITGLMLLLLLVSACQNGVLSGSNKNSSLIPSISNSLPSAGESSSTSSNGENGVSTSTPTPSQSTSSSTSSVSTPSQSTSSSTSSVSTPSQSTSSSTQKPSTTVNNLYAAEKIETNAPNYYDSVKGLKGEALKNALNELIDDHQTFSYGSKINEYMKEYDQDPNNSNNIILIYTGTNTKNYNFNKEHVWAKSHGDFGTSKGAGSDLHNLRPCDEALNSTRSSLNFAEGGEEITKKDMYRGNYKTSSTFEPRDDFKGDVARTIFYMATRYDDASLDLEVSSPSNTSRYNNFSKGATGTHGNFDDLYKWATSGQDPVDDYEVRRNNIIYKDYQHNRNPFVDHPEFIIMIYDKNYNGPGALLDMVPGAKDPQVAINNVISLIDKIGTVTLNSLTAIENAEKAYAALSSSDKALVTNYSDLENARKTYNDLYENTIVEHVISLIASIGEVTIEDKATIEEAETTYAKLTQTLKDQVTNYNTLVSAREQLNEIIANIETQNKILYTATFGNAENVSSYGPYNFTLNGGSWSVNCAYRQGAEFRLGFNSSNKKTLEAKFSTPLGLSSSTAGGSLEMNFDISNGKYVEFTFGGIYGTVTNVYILKSLDGGKTYIKCKEVTYSSSLSSLVYESSLDAKVRYALVITGSTPRLIVNTVTIKGVEI